VNDEIFMDLENPQILQCIVYKLEKTSNIILSQSFVLKKGLIKYNKINGLTPMKTHVDIAHPRFFVLRKTQLVKKAIIGNVKYTQQKRKKRTRPFSSAITTYFGFTNPYKNNDEAHHMFIEDLVLYICKRYRTLSIT
jgi:phytoene dehydrogenase-like protein